MLLALKYKTKGNIISQMAARGLVGQVNLMQAAAVTDAVHLWASNAIPYSLIHIGGIAGVATPSPVNPGTGVFTLPYFPGAASIAPAFGLPGQVPIAVLDAVSAGLAASWSNTLWVGHSPFAAGVGMGMNIVNPATLMAWMQGSYWGRFLPGVLTPAMQAMINALTTSISIQFQAGIYAPIGTIGPTLPAPATSITTHLPTAGPILSVPGSRWIPA